MSAAPAPSSPSPSGAARRSRFGLWLALACAWLLLSALIAALQAPAPIVGFQRVDTGTLAWWRYPVEANAHRRLPTLTTRSLQSIHMHADGQRGWAVGDGGTILHTRDGGQRWEAQTSGTTQSLWSVSLAGDGQRGWAVGRDGTILHTRDGGQRWEAQASGTTQSLFSVSMSGDGRRGWAVGSRGTILHTRDGGLRWEVQAGGRGENLIGLSLSSDGQQGWAVGVGGTILHTNDEGQRWEAQGSGTTQTLWGVRLSGDGRRGWAVGEAGTILRTNDGGQRWEVQASGTTQNLWSVSLAADGQRGLVVGVGGEILNTSDGGQRWEAQTGGRTAHNLTSVSLEGKGQQGWAVGWQGTILHTRDGGQHWQAQTSGASQTLTRVSLTSDGQRGWSVGLGGTILRTRDGGRHWEAQFSGTQQDLWDVSLSSDGQRGWAVGEAGTILRTNDGGERWTAQHSGTTQALASVSLASDGQRGWAAGNGGTILHTRDGGQRWGPQDSGTQESLTGVSLSGDGQRGWAVGRGWTILHTSDGGRSWQERPSEGAQDLSSVSLTGDGRRGWVVGGGGTILHTRDGGQRWEAQDSGTTQHLWGVSLAGDGQRGWAVGWGGTILHTRDGGRRWETQASGTTLDLTSVSLAGEGQWGWVAGAGGTILHTNDGGQTWVGLSYRRWPAPWFWASLLLTLSALALAWRSARPQAGRRSVADLAASDAAVAEAAEDRLDFLPLARGLSRFLRNTETRPPLTLAVTGDWGTGKSSLMQLTCADLRRYGHRPIWFNAWHHQKEEHLFAALLGAIRDQVAPPAWSPAGLAFRLRLLWIRSRQHALWAIALGVLAVALLTWLQLHSADEWGILWRELQAPQRWLDLGTALLTGQKLPPGLDLPELWAQLITGLTVLLGLKRGMTAVGVDPAQLMVGAAEGLKLKDASAHNSFRARFAEQFGEVTDALPHRLVIVIDDLDRCRPEAVLEVLEAVNYLTSSGRCFVIFGMATERVQAALGIAFERLAKELAEAGHEAPDEREQRRRYARDYLQKLVNIEIKVPTRDDVQAHRLLVQREAADDASGRVAATLWRRVGQAVPLLVITGVIAAGIGLGMWFEPSKRSPKEVAPAASAPASAAASGAASAAAPSPPPVTPPREPPAARLDEVRPGDTSQAHAWAIGGTVLAVLLAAAGLLVHRMRQAVQQVRDSQDFVDALEVWTTLVARSRNTPRAIKRFGNRIRYLAMLQQGEADDRTVREQWAEAFERLVARWRSRGEAASGAAADAAPPAPARSGALSEAQLIALGACHEAAGARWREWVEGNFTTDPDSDLAPAIAVYRDLSEKHVDRFRIQWPPSEEEQAIFERLLAGVRLPGDVEVVVPLKSELTSFPDVDPGKAWPFTSNVDLVASGAKKRSRRKRASPPSGSAEGGAEPDGPA